MTEPWPNPANIATVWPNTPTNPALCSVCGEKQFNTNSGVTCPNGHGGVDPAPTNPLDAMSEDQLLMLWDSKKKAIEAAKEEEMDLRKYIVGRAFPKKQEGTNTKELGNGYQLKAAIKYNYNLADNDTVEDCLSRIAKIDNTGAFIADRLVSWKPNFLLTEYKALVEDKEKGSKSAENILNIVNQMLTITEAAPSLEIKEPKGKK